ncbi:hypothetical protein MK079_01395 [Candidatus Gracilibacteria bacterium]|nr:hypothetical protein [Candidatus Gracilibacteria bacterium]
MQEISDQILEKIQHGTEHTPLLFLGHNTDLLDAHIKDVGNTLLGKLSIPLNYLFILEDTGESIKVQDIKHFFEAAYSLPSYGHQIFYVENISRLTLSASNSMLKLLEEPGKHNIILLGNASESGILDTILSRVQIVYTGLEKHEQKDNFFYDLIEQFDKHKDTGIFGYFFQTKIEKEDAIIFLKTLTQYIKNTGNFTATLDTISEDIDHIGKNNVNARYIIDKYLLLIQES